jgi:hypothetical protein
MAASSREHLRGQNVTEEATETVTVSGMEIELSGDRAVFVGRRDGDACRYFRFRNGADETKIKLSAEAVDAMLDLLGATTARGLAREYRLEMEVAPLGWHAVYQDQE